VMDKTVSAARIAILPGDLVRSSSFSRNFVALSLAIVDASVKVLPFNRY